MAATIRALPHAKGMVGDASRTMSVARLKAKVKIAPLVPSGTG